MPNRFARIAPGEHGHDGGDAQFGQPVRMRGVVGRQVDREAGLDGRSEQTPVLDSDKIVAEDGLVGEGDGILAGVGSDELTEQLTVDLRTVSRQVACLCIAPQAARPERRDLGAELRPGTTGKTAGYAIPVDGESAGFGVTAFFLECAARPA